MTMRAGIDVGGTNTDAAVMDGERVVAKAKTPTTADVSIGITSALRRVLDDATCRADEIAAVMIGTTHFTNAIVERRQLQPTAAIRLGLPATAALPPMIDWPSDLRDTIGNRWFLCHGGHEFDGREIAPFDPDEVRRAAAKIAEAGVMAVAVSSVFSPVNAALEERAAEIIAAEIPGATITRSHTIGRLGLLERESAAILNACLHDVAAVTIQGFRRAIHRIGIQAPLYLTQNDGTLMSAEFAECFPVFTVASGPTNSMRGAAFLSGRQDALVIDIGGTTADVGALTHGFPREASFVVEVGGVRTNFRMPDVTSIGLGGGSLIGTDPLTIGPQSVGYRPTREALIFGGTTLTATDIAVAAGSASLGDACRVRHLDSTLVQTALDAIHTRAERAIDRVKLNATPIPLIIVGGGSILLNRALAGSSEMIKPDHFEAADAVGAAIAQISGEVDRVYVLSELSREQALSAAKKEAADQAIAAGADPGTIRIVDVDDVPLAYLPGNATRIRIKTVGDLALANAAVPS
jgi:N-methylhydantoinase A/oxoprolinase/acetone carboxylase beta subunit